MGSLNNKYEIYVYFIEVICVNFTRLYAVFYCLARARVYTHAHTIILRFLSCRINELMLGIYVLYFSNKQNLGPLQGTNTYKKYPHMKNGRFSSKTGGFN